jgi:sarcosine oxidase
VVDFDCIVVGIGGVGSAIAYHAARSGIGVLGVEQFDLNHTHGSSHGSSRIYRSAYFEGSIYVPLVLRAQTLWAELERSSGTRLMARTGALIIGPRSGPTVAGALRSASDHGLPHRVLPSGDLASEFPQFAVRPSDVGLWEPNAGVLFPESCIEAHVKGARAAGADLRFRVAAERWDVEAGRISVQTGAGSFTAKRLVLAGGAWTRRLVEDLSLPLSIERQVVHWYPPAREQSTFLPDRMPVFIWDTGAARRFYGLPDMGDGVKVATEAGTTVSTPESADRTVTDADRAPVNSFVREFLPKLRPVPSASVTCLYTNSPDHNFLIGRHPAHPNVLLVSACSGHGFKFTSVIGEIVSRMLLGQDPLYPIDPFDPGRFESYG